MKERRLICKVLVLVMILTSISALTIMPVSATGINWPSGQVLPSFSLPAANLDLMDVTYSSNYEAEGSSFTRPTGHDDVDGWLCQCGIDAVGYMLVGPSTADIPAGVNTARFEIKIDNNTADNNPMVRCEVYDATANQMLAQSIITRQQFTSASTYLPFKVQYTNSDASHVIQFKVYWYGGAYIKVNNVSSVSKDKAEECVMLTTLKGLVNKSQPRIYSYNGDEEGKYNWLNSLGLGYTEVTDNWSLVAKYRSSISGIVIYDDTLNDTINLATTIASLNDGIVASPALASRLTAAPYNLPVIQDLRGSFTTKTQVYQYMYDNCWPQVTHRLIMGLNPEYIFGNVRDYAAAAETANVWLDPSVPAEDTILREFLADMPSGNGIYMGWWKDEGVGISRASEYGVSTCASDWSENLTVMGGTSRNVNVKPVPNKPALQNKIYISLILSDGDNLQYMEHRFKKLWDSTNRGQVPLSWTVSPAMLDAMPGALNYIYNTATDNDCLISGPSGLGYTYPNMWTNSAYLDSYTALSNDYCNRAGLKVVTIWNTINGATSTGSGNSFANNAPSLLGLTAQNAGGGITVYNNVLPSQGLNATYCPTEQSMYNEINSAISGWDGNSPRFVTIQANPWEGINYQSFVNVKNYYSSNSNIVFVRADNYFQLMRENNNLPVDTSAIVAKYEAENNSFATSPLSHGVGFASDDGWAADTAADAPGHMIYGPYTTALPQGDLSATFKVLVDNNTADNLPVATIDVRDASNGQLLASSDLLRQQFTTPGKYQDFSLAFTNPGNGHSLEFRVYYHDIAFVRVDKITVTKNIRKYEAEGAVIAHGCGRKDGDGWSASTSLDNSAHMVYGPYEKLPVGTKKVTFKMLTDNSTLGSQTVATIDVRDAVTGLSLASQNLSSQQFTAANQYQDFSLTFNNTDATHPLEYRVYFNDAAGIKVDSITVN